VLNEPTSRELTVTKIKLVIFKKNKFLLSAADYNFLIAYKRLLKKLEAVILQVNNVFFFQKLAYPSPETAQP